MGPNTEATVEFNEQLNKYIGFIRGTEITRQGNLEKCLFKLAKYVKGQH